MRRTLLLLALVASLASGCAEKDHSRPRPAHAPTALRENGGPLAPGTYRMGVQAFGNAPSALVDVPPGWVSGSTWYLVTPDKREFLGLWEINGVHPDPCHGRTADLVSPGASVRDLATALVAQRSTTTTAPRAVTLAGHHGLYLELRSPRDLSGCNEEQNNLWGQPGGRCICGPGQVDRLWILDVDGLRIVVDAAYSDQSQADDVAALGRIVASLRFEKGGAAGR